MGLVEGGNLTDFFFTEWYTGRVDRTGGANGREAMVVFLDLVILLNFLVDLMLLVGANRLAGFSPGFLRVLPGALLGGVYGGLCMVPGFRFLGNLFWRLIFLALIAASAYGLHRSAIRRGGLFVLLSMALGGVAELLGRADFGALSLAALGVCMLCLWGFQDKTLGRTIEQVELSMGDRKTTVSALRDTGNTLRDPLTGQGILVAGADAAWSLLGLTSRELSDPVHTVASGRVPGARLVPYRAVGNGAGILLAVHCPSIRVGGKTGGGLVAFTAEGLGKECEYQALLGGVS